MELRSYDESYLPHAMNLMSSMLECAVDHFHQDADRFFHLFLLSPLCERFESGDSVLLQDHTGLELCCMVEVVFPLGIAYICTDFFDFLTQALNGFDGVLFVFPSCL